MRIAQLPHAAGAQKLGRKVRQAAHIGRGRNDPLRLRAKLQYVVGHGILRGAAAHRQRKGMAKGYRRLGNDARGGIAQGLSRFVFVKQYDLRVQFTHSSVKICTDVSPSNCGSFTAITSEREVGMFLPT